MLVTFYFRKSYATMLINLPFFEWLSFVGMVCFCWNGLSLPTNFNHLPLLEWLCLCWNGFSLPTNFAFVRMILAFQ